MLLILIYFLCKIFRGRRGKGTLHCTSHTCTLRSDTHPAYAVKVFPRGCNLSQFLITKNGSPTKYLRTLSNNTGWLQKLEAILSLLFLVFTTCCFLSQSLFLSLFISFCNKSVHEQG